MWGKTNTKLHVNAVGSPSFSLSVVYTYISFCCPTFFFFLSVRILMQKFIITQNLSLFFIQRHIARINPFISTSSSTSSSFLRFIFIHIHAQAHTYRWYRSAKQFYERNQQNEMNHPWHYVVTNNEYAPNV